MKNSQGLALLLTLAVFCLLGTSRALAADPQRLSFTKVFPGSSPAYVSITVERTGTVAYKEALDEDPETFQLEEDFTATIFDLAEKLNHFKNPLESGLKVANMGQKTLRWESGAEKHEAKFNYSLDENARLLQDWFERIGESERLFATLRRAARYDKLGVNDAVLKIEIALNQKRLVGVEQFLPLLDRVAKNDTYLHMARDRAERLADTFRTTAKPKTP